MGNTADFMNRLRMIFYAIASGPLLFFLVAYLQRKEMGDMTTVELNAIFLGVLIMVAVGAVGMGHVVRGKILETARQKESLREKLNMYQTATIIRLATFEGPSLLAVVFFYLEGHALFAAVFLALLIGISMAAPTTDTVARDLNLSREEADIIKTGGDFPD